MTLWPIFLCLAALTLLLRRWVLPRLGTALSNASGFRATRLAGQRAILGYLAAAAQAAALAALALLVWVWLLGHTGGTLADVSRGLSSLREWRGRLSHGSVLWAKAAAVCVIFGFALYMRKRARVSCTKALARAREREFERVKVLYFAGELPPLPPTPSMTRINRRHAELSDTIAHVQTPLFARDQAAAELLKRMEQEREELTIAHAREAIEQHMKATLDPDDVELPKRRGFLGGLETFFMSRGLLVNLARPQKVLLYGSLALLLPAYVEIYAPQAGAILAKQEQSLQTRRLELQDVELRLQAEAARAEWEKALGQSATAAPAALTAEDLDAINVLAAKFEDTQSQDPVWNSAPQPAGNAFQLRSMVMRDRILNGLAARRPAGLAAQPSVLAAGKADREFRGAVQIAEEIGAPHAPETTAGKRFAENLREMAARGGESVRTRLRAEANAFRKVATLADFHEAAVRHLSGAISEGDAAFFTDVAEHTEPGQRRRMHTYEQARADRAAAAYASGKDVKDAAAAASSTESKTAGTFAELQEIVRTGAERMPPPERAASAFAQRPPTIDPVVDTPGLQKATDALAELRRTSSRSPQSFVPMADSLVGYPDYFPGQINADESTVAAEVRRRFQNQQEVGGLFAERPPPPEPGVSGGGGGGGFSGGGNFGGSEGGAFSKAPGPHAPSGGRPSSSSSSFRSVSAMAESRTGQIFRPPTSVATSAASSLARARSFTGLRGFSRVGGVLIGQDPSVKIAPGVVGLRWEWLAPDKLCLVLKTPDGTEHRSRQHRATLVQHALHYAADQRPLAVTMAKATPLLELKVLLHPALLDTPLGASIVDLDRLVDEHTGRSEFRQAATQRVISEDQLYQLAWATRLLTAQSSGARLHANFDALFDEAQAMLQDEKRKKLAATVLGHEFAAPATSPLAVKPEFYDKSLVSALQRAVPEAKSLEALLRQLREGFEPLAAPISRILDKIGTKTLYKGDASDSELENVDHWLAFPPTFEDWSGVREKPLLGNLSDILVPENQPIPQVLDFMLQISFTSNPAFVPRQGGRDSADYIDKKPWEFPAIKERIEAGVLENLTDKNRATLNDALEFSMLQRLFRSAFNGQLGEAFPIERLGDLSEELAAKVPERAWRTPRWNARGGALEAQAGGLFLALAKSLREQGASPSFCAAVDACAGAMQKNLDLRGEAGKGLDALMQTRHVQDPAWRGAWESAWARRGASLQDWENDWETLAARLRETRISAGAVDTALLDSILYPGRRAPSNSSKTGEMTRLGQLAKDKAAELTAALKIRRALAVEDDERLGYDVEVGLRVLPPR